MNIHEISRRSGASLSTLRKLDRLDVLKVDASDPATEKMRRYLSTKAPLTVELLLKLLEEPDLAYDLGKYEDRAREQVAALGDVKASLAPKSVTAYTSEAARGDPEACAILARWLADVLPVTPVSHYWVATRLLAGLPGNLREADLRSVNVALLHVRKLPQFEKYWSVDNGGKRATIFYRQPIKTLDL